MFCGETIGTRLRVFDEPGFDFLVFFDVFLELFLEIQCIGAKKLIRR
jgi:hypothetical protein